MRANRKINMHKAQQNFKILKSTVVRWHNVVNRDVITSAVI